MTAKTRDGLRAKARSLLLYAPDEGEGGTSYSQDIRASLLEDLIGKGE